MNDRGRRSQAAFPFKYELMALVGIDVVAKAAGRDPLLVFRQFVADLFAPRISNAAAGAPRPPPRPLLALLP